MVSSGHRLSTSRSVLTVRPAPRASTASRARRRSPGTSTSAPSTYSTNGPSTPTCRAGLVASMVMGPRACPRPVHGVTCPHSFLGRPPGRRGATSVVVAAVIGLSRAVRRGDRARQRRASGRPHRCPRRRRLAPTLTKGMTHDRAHPAARARSRRGDRLLRQGRRRPGPRLQRRARLPRRTARPLAHPRLRRVRDQRRARRALRHLGAIRARVALGPGRRGLRDVRRRDPQLRPARRARDGARRRDAPRCPASPATR